jgi:hypothetical protein
MSKVVVRKKVSFPPFRSPWQLYISDLHNNGRSNANQNTTALVFSFATLIFGSRQEF